MIPFSPIYENKIPDEADALYLGGGFPENYVSEIASNKLTQFTALRIKRLAN